MRSICLSCLGRTTAGPNGPAGAEARGARVLGLGGIGAIIDATTAHPLPQNASDVLGARVCQARGGSRAHESLCTWRQVWRILCTRNHFSRKPGQRHIAMCGATFRSISNTWTGPIP